MLVAAAARAAIGRGGGQDYAQHNLLQRRSLLSESGRSNLKRRRAPYAYSPKSQTLLSPLLLRVSATVSRPAFRIRGASLQISNYTGLMSNLHYNILDVCRPSPSMLSISLHCDDCDVCSLEVLRACCEGCCRDEPVVAAQSHITTFAQYRPQDQRNARLWREAASHRDSVELTEISLSQEEDG